MNALRHVWWFARAIVAEVFGMVVDEPLIGVFVVVLVPAGIWYPIFGMSHVDTISRAAVLMLALGVVAFVLREAWAKHWEYAKRFTASADPGRARPSSAS